MKQGVHEGINEALCLYVYTHIHCPFLYVYMYLNVHVFITHLSLSVAVRTRPSCSAKVEEDSIQRDYRGLLQTLPSQSIHATAC